MNFERAREIFNAGEVIRVFHNDTPIWIEDLNAEENSVTIKPLYGQWGTTQVPVEELVEG